MHAPSSGPDAHAYNSGELQLTVLAQLPSQPPSQTLDTVTPLHSDLLLSMPPYLPSPPTPICTDTPPLPAPEHVCSQPESEPEREPRKPEGSAFFFWSRRPKHARAGFAQVSESAAGAPLLPPQTGLACGGWRAQSGWPAADAGAAHFSVDSSEGRWSRPQQQDVDVGANASMGRMVHWGRGCEDALMVPSWPLPQAACDSEPLVSMKRR